MAIAGALAAHLQSGVTTLCRAWALTRRDGVVLGFTDHDLPLSFEGVAFTPDSGMSAAAIQAGTGLAVDNSEALGVLSHDSLREEDIAAGRFDGAGVTAWLVNWADVAQRTVLFKGSLGEVKRGAGAFQAELRGQAEALNKPWGYGYRFTVTDPDYFTEIAVEQVAVGKHFTFTGLAGFADRWFERGRVAVLTGAAAGLVAWVKNDRLIGGIRKLELWEGLRAEIAPGDMIRIEADYAKHPGFVPTKYSHYYNLHAFPHIPGEDWLLAVPSSKTDNSGGSLQR
ncbi:MAG: DUF2163 domain-containing protein [Pseudomonadota bacterium]